MGDWHTKSIGEIASIIMGQSPDGKFYNSEEKGMPFLQGCSEFGDIFPESTVYSTEITKIATSGSILFSVRAPVGKTNLADKNYCIGRGVASIEGVSINTILLNYYLLNKLNTKGFTSQGSTFDSINNSELSKIRFLIPKDEDEQNVITNILTYVDQVISKNSELIAKYKRIRTGLMQELLEFKDEFTSGPKFKITTFLDICEINPSRPTLNDSAVVSFLGMSDVSESAKIISGSERLYAEVAKGFTSFKDGDILVAKITPCFENGKGAYAHGLINGFGFGSTEFHVLRPKSNISGRLVYYITTSNKFRIAGRSVMIGSAGQQRVQSSFFSQFKFRIPTSLEEQEHIADILEAQDQLIQSEEENLIKFKLIKKGLMQDLLNGKVRVDVLMEQTAESV